MRPRLGQTASAHTIQMAKTVHSEARYDDVDEVGENDIAIVGMALRVPGANGVDEFWRNLRVPYPPKP